MSCIEEEIRNVDNRIAKNMGIDNVQPYGIASRHLNSNKQVINLVDNPQHEGEGTLAYWDDRYNFIWFHRINNIRIESNEKGYGKLNWQYTEVYNISLVVAGKRKVTYLGDTKTISQLSSYNYFVGILSTIQGIEFEFVELDMSRVERDEFKEGFTGKETIMFRIDYELRINNVQPCLRKNVCIEEDC
jgi:hypothetical protein